MDEPHAPKLLFLGETESWFGSLSQRDQQRFSGRLELLRRRGSALGRPAVDRIKGSELHRMKELRSSGKHLRILFAFDPNQNIALLVGGDKEGNWKGWYRENIPKADKVYRDHLRSIGKEDRCRSHGTRSAGRPR